MNQFKMLDELKLAKQKPLTNLNECRQRFVEKYVISPLSVFHTNKIAKKIE